jgi:YVTN family beta-propeller protein
MGLNRRQFVIGGTALITAMSMRTGGGQPVLLPEQDRVFICNEDSNTLAVIDRSRNTVVDTVNLTSFDEDPRPPFRLVTGGVTPTHLAMVRKPLYHGAIDIHGAAPSPDNTLIATTGRGTSNVYLIETSTLRVIGNVANPQASELTNKERITSGLLVGREPHEPTFTRNGAELWVTVRGEGRIAIFDVAAAKSGRPLESALRGYIETINGPAQCWFSKDGKVAFVASQKVAQIDLLETNFGADGRSMPKRLKTVDVKAQDPRRIPAPSRRFLRLRQTVERSGSRTSFLTRYRPGAPMASCGRWMPFRWAIMRGPITSSSSRTGAERPCT